MLRGGLMQRCRDTYVDYVGAFYQGLFAMDGDYGDNVDASRHGGDRRARDVAEAACPGDPAVHAMYAKTELRLGRSPALSPSSPNTPPRRSGWWTSEVRDHRNALRLTGFAGSSACAGAACVRPPSRTRHGYERLLSA
ncbi:hypothetical protein GUJ93_ZPchr0011g27209 [Zizania palustris]|uniref:Uncharacterized protein n=1 Tax=Zizania palustris TaxID=103762 RepID=A0A8J5WHU7_ZIZPA|nr:hypothetical protein GUJ93_ZPchr0011g27209 [Zizania palustris]